MSTHDQGLSVMISSNVWVFSCQNDIDPDVMRELNPAHVVNISEKEIKTVEAIHQCSLNMNCDINQLVATVCDFLAEENQSAPSTPKRVASDKERLPHSRYTSYDSTATRTPPHASLTWRSVDTPSSCATDEFENSLANTPVTPIKEETSMTESELSEHEGTSNAIMDESENCSPNVRIASRDNSKELILVYGDISQVKVVSVLLALVMAHTKDCLKEAVDALYKKIPNSPQIDDECAGVLMKLEKDLRPQSENSLTVQELTEYVSCSVVPEPEDAVTAAEEHDSSSAEEKQNTPSTISISVEDTQQVETESRAEEVTAVDNPSPDTLVSPLHDATLTPHAEEEPVEEVAPDDDDAVKRTNSKEAPGCHCACIVM